MRCPTLTCCEWHSKWPPPWLCNACIPCPIMAQELRFAWSSPHLRRCCREVLEACFLRFLVLSIVQGLILLPLFFTLLLLPPDALRILRSAHVPVVKHGGGRSEGPGTQLVAQQRVWIPRAECRRRRQALPENVNVKKMGRGGGVLACSCARGRLEGQGLLLQLFFADACLGPGPTS